MTTRTAVLGALALWTIAVPLVLWYLLTPREHPEVRKRRKALAKVNKV